MLGATIHNCERIGEIERAGVIGPLNWYSAELPIVCANLG